MTLPARRLGGLLRALTVRGRCFLAVGAGCVVLAVLLGQMDLLLRVGVLLVAVPLLSTWAVSRTRYRLACSREVSPPRVGAGQDAQVVLRLDNLSRLPTGLLLVEDRVPALLGARARFVLDRVEPLGQRAVAYTVCSEGRGRYPVGPLSLRLADPFGMCELRRSFTARDLVTVTPRTTPLPPLSLGGEWSGSGASRSRSLAAAGDDDVTTREYRYGDALHRVHWRSTARYGELMVRREEQPWQSRATVLLDTRARAHRGVGVSPATSSVEAAVSAAASVGVHLLRGGYQLRLVSDLGSSVGGGATDLDTAAGEAEGLLLDALAVLEPSGGSGLGQLLPALRAGGDSLVVAVLGAVDPHEAAELGRLHRTPTTAVAVLVDVDSWTPPAARSERAVEEAHHRHDGAAAVLAAEGWRVLRLRCGDDLAQLWPAIAHRDGLPRSGERTSA